MPPYRRTSSVSFRRSHVPRTVLDSSRQTDPYRARLGPELERRAATLSLSMRAPGPPLDIDLVAKRDRQPRLLWNPAGFRCPRGVGSRPFTAGHCTDCLPCPTNKHTESQLPKQRGKQQRRSKNPECKREVDAVPKAVTQQVDSHRARAQPKPHQHKRQRHLSPPTAVTAAPAAVERPRAPPIGSRIGWTGSTTSPLRPVFRGRMSLP